MAMSKLHATVTLDVTFFFLFFFVFHLACMYVLQPNQVVYRVGNGILGSETVEKNNYNQEDRMP